MLTSNGRNQYRIKFLVVVLILFLIFACPVKLVRVNGASMSPEIEDNNLLLILRMHSTEYKVGDNIVFSKDDNILVKMIVATYEHPTLLFKPPEHSVAVMGNNRTDTIDSLTWENPYIGCEDIKGKVVHIFSKE